MSLISVCSVLLYLSISRLSVAYRRRDFTVLVLHLQLESVVCDMFFTFVAEFCTIDY